MAKSGWWTLAYYPPSGEAIAATGGTLQEALGSVRAQAVERVPIAEYTAKLLAEIVDEVSHVLL